MNWTLIIAVICSGFFTVLAQCFIKAGLNVNTFACTLKAFTGYLLTWQLWLGIFFQVIAMLATMTALNTGRVNTALPLVQGMTFLFLVPMTYFILHEKVGPWQGAGMGLILSGIIMVARTSGS